MGYISFVHGVTQNAILATMIMLLALTTVSASAAQILTPDEYKPSNLASSLISNPQNFFSNLQKDKNPYTPLLSDADNNVVSLEACDLSIKYPKVLINKRFKVNFNVQYMTLYPGSQVLSGSTIFGESWAYNNNLNQNGNQTNDQNGISNTSLSSSKINDSNSKPTGAVSSQMSDSQNRAEILDNSSIQNQNTQNETVNRPDPNALGGNTLLPDNSASNNPQDLSVGDIKSNSENQNSNTIQSKGQNTTQNTQNSIGGANDGQKTRENIDGSSKPNPEINSENKESQKIQNVLENNISVPRSYGFTFGC